MPMNPYTIPSSDTDHRRHVAITGFLVCLIILLIIILWAFGASDDPEDPHHSEILEHLGQQIHR